MLMLSQIGRVLRWIGLGGIAVIVWFRLAFAYIDPNTGGMLFQLLAAIFAFFSGIMLFFSRYIRMAFGRTRRMLRGSPKASPHWDEEKATDPAANEERPRDDEG